ncbi:MAG: radical SAM protein [Sulfuricurvum sp.]
MPSCIFGPVRSRRFGVSLGIDLSPSIKQCNFDCLYCELSPAKAIAKQREIIPVETVIRELQEALSAHPDIDVITITANGEPTMYPDLEPLIEQINTFKGSKETLILSNSASLSDEKVSHTLLKFDQVKLSLDAATPEIFAKIDRPAEGIEIAMIIQSIIRFSHRFGGKLFLEILFVKGVNDAPTEIAALNHALLQIKCDRIDIGTVDRPPAYAVQALSYDELYSLSHLFDPQLPIHIVTRSHTSTKVGNYTEEEILTTLDKRPLTAEDIEALFDSASKKRFQILKDQGKIVQIERSNIHFFIPSTNLHRKRSK